MSPAPQIPPLVCNTSSRPALHLYQASSKYSEGYSRYRAETRNQIQTQEGEITPKVKKPKLSFLYVTSSGAVLNYYQVSSKYSRVFDLRSGPEINA